MTRDFARLYFRSKGLVYADISSTDLQLLWSLLNKHFAKTRQERNRAGLPVYWKRATGLRGEFNENGSMIWANVAANGPEFVNTNAISFNRTGYIGFCGDADGDDLDTVLCAFVEWCDEMAALKELGGGDADHGNG